MSDLSGYDIESGIEKKCPVCNSKRISLIETYQVWTVKNLQSNRIIKKDTRLTPFGRVFHSYVCRKCGWESENIYE